MCQVENVRALPSHSMNLNDKTAIGAIQIRPYRPSDKDQVIHTFTNSMKSLTPALIRASIQVPTVVAIYAAWMLAVMFGVYQQWLTTNEKQFYTASLILVFACTAIVLPYIGIRYDMTSTLSKFLQEAIDSDLNDIENVYDVGIGTANKEKVNGAKGTFLVAEDANGNIVGTVGGQNKGDGVFELRRMSVDARVRNQGVGSRMISNLEDQLKPKKMYLVCSSVQYAACALYEKNGFQLVRKFTFDGASVLFREAIQMREYEKLYDTDILSKNKN